MCILMEDFREDPLTGRCLSDMLIMWHTDYERERYIYFMFNFNLFIIVPWKLTTNFLKFVCYRIFSHWRWHRTGRSWRTFRRLWCLSMSAVLYVILSSLILPIAHLPCSTLHFLLLLLSDGAMRLLHFIFCLGRLCLLIVPSPHPRHILDGSCY